MRITFVPLWVALVRLIYASPSSPPKALYRYIKREDVTTKGINYNNVTMNEADLCKVDFNYTTWVEYGIPDYFRESLQNVRESNPRESFQDHLIKDLKETGKLRAIYDPCNGNEKCDGRVSEMLHDACPAGPRKAWILQAYRNYAKFHIELSEMIQARLIRNIYPMLAKFPKQFALKESEPTNNAIPYFVLTMVASLASLPMPGPAKGAGQTAKAAGEIAKLVGPLVSSAAFEASGAMHLVDGLKNPPMQDANWEIFGDVSTMLPDLETTFERSFRALVDRTLAPSGDITDLDDLSVPEAALMHQDYITKLPDLHKDADWKAFDTAMYGPFINYIWQQKAIPTKKQRWVKGVFIVRQRNACNTGTIFGPQSICDGQDLMTLVNVHRKHKHEHPKLKKVPGIGLLDRYGIKLSDVMMSSWRAHQAHGYGASTMSQAEAARALGDSDILKKSRNMSEIPSVDRTFFTLPVCEIDKTWSLFRGKRCSGGHRYGKYKHKEDCRLFYASICGCARLPDMNGAVWPLQRLCRHIDT